MNQDQTVLKSKASKESRNCRKEEKKQRICFLKFFFLNFLFSLAGNNLAILYILRESLKTVGFHLISNKIFRVKLIENIFVGVKMILVNIPRNILHNLECKPLLTFVISCLRHSLDIVVFPWFLLTIGFDFRIYIGTHPHTFLNILIIITNIKYF